ncbi:Hint domain-containing protein [Psychromarinibacter halotolerans]|uniref:Hint domain-containing protein n=1 Tax=Psychromarinibacter halotolerans TaxID=1775175 RepID=A0ABV7GTI9_9RHOB|nr:Hint domain-containing protein [Psychromarinibacter halotolerans]MDF0594717.1 Hint domain-containing protein [Psychromarinibacter halotolerans]
MAEYVLPAGSPITVYEEGTFFDHVDLAELWLYDFDPGDDQFSYTETLSSRLDGIDYVDFTFLGTTSYGGREYPVIQEVSGDLLVLGVNLPEASYPDVASLNLDTSDFPVCFAAGTGIATPNGERAVETLEIGDLILTEDGRVVPVRWIGRQTMHKLFAGDRMAPVRVRAGALGDGLPHSDLVLTPDHALTLDGLAITAGALVNGATITLDPLDALPETVTYYHVETDAHDVILANGAAAETFVDAVTRRRFDNHAEYAALYGEDRVIEEMPLPRVASARLVPAGLRARLGIEDAA